MDIENLKPLIIESLSELDIPVVPLCYDGKKRTYVVFNILNDKEINFANDIAYSAKQSINIHLYSDNDYVSLLNKIKKNLINNKFEDVELIYETYEKDTGLYHVTLSADYEYTNINNLL